MSRVWEQRNEEATKILRDPSTKVLQTVEPFSTRDDALKAEAIAIHVAALTGKRVTVAPDDEDESTSFHDDEGFVTLNRAGTESSTVLGPAILRKPGVVAYEDLRATAIVTISADSMDGRPSPYGMSSGAVFSERARKWWSVSPRLQTKVERLIAVLSGSGGLIVGDWDVDPRGSYGEDGDVFPLVDADADDPRGTKGMQLTGVRTQPNRIYSADLRR
jgi:hypothetical protein